MKIIKRTCRDEGREAAILCVGVPRVRLDHLRGGAGLGVVPEPHAAVESRDEEEVGVGGEGDRGDGRVVVANDRLQALVIIIYS